MSEATKGNSVQWHIRASACELLSFSFRFPTTSLVDALEAGEWADAAREIWDALGLALPDKWASDIMRPDFNTLRVEATRLFVGSPDPVCSPYEGYWRAKDEGVQPLMFVNPHSMKVERFAKACGLGQAKGTNEPLDHIATEFELMQFLASVEAGIAMPFEEGPAVDSFPGGGAGAAYELFFTDHVKEYAPRVAATLEKESRLPYYRAVGQLLTSYLA